MTLEGSAAPLLCPSVRPPAGGLSWSPLAGCHSQKTQNQKPNHKTTTTTKPNHYYNTETIGRNDRRNDRRNRPPEQTTGTDHRNDRRRHNHSKPHYTTTRTGTAAADVRPFGRGAQRQADDHGRTPQRRV